MVYIAIIYCLLLILLIPVAYGFCSILKHCKNGTLNSIATLLLFALSICTGVSLWYFIYIINN